MWKLDALFWLMDIPLCWAPRWVIFGWLCSGSGGCSAGFTDAPIGFGHSRVTGLLYVYNLSDAPAWVTNDPIGTRCSRVLCLWVFIIQQILRSTIGHSVVHSRNGLGASAGRFTKLGRFIGHSATSADAPINWATEPMLYVLVWDSCYFGVVDIHACALYFRNYLRDILVLG